LFSIDGATPTDFKVAATDNETNPCKSGVPVLPGQSCHIYAEFGPVSEGGKAAVIKIGNAKAVTMTGLVPDSTSISASIP